VTVDWDRINRLELELLEARNYIKELEDRVANPPIRLVPRQAPPQTPATCPVCGILISASPKVDC
jgi:hypothetical protein